MPHSWDSRLIAALAQPVIKMCHLMVITRVDGTVLRFTDHDQDLIIGGNTYESAYGFNMSALAEHNNAEPSDAEVVGLLNSAQISDVDLRAGKFRMADVLIQIAIWSDLTIPPGTRNSFKMANTVVSDGAKVKLALIGKEDLLRQRTDWTFSRRCSVRRLGDLQCKVDLTPFRFTRTVASAPVNLLGNTPAPVLQIDCGSGTAVSSWVADTPYVVGAYNTLSTGSTVDLSQVTNPAPMAVYQTGRNGVAANLNFEYLVTGLTALNGYHIRLHFASIASTKPGGSTNVICQGETVVYALDTYLAAGGTNIAFVEEFDVIADTSGNIDFLFISINGHAYVNGIEIMSPVEGNVQNGTEFASDPAPTGFYNEGFCYWQTGLNAGIISQIKTHIGRSGAAYIQFHEKPPFVPQASDIAILEAGCDRGRMICNGRFNNGTNYHGQVDLPGNDAISAIGR